MNEICCFTLNVNISKDGDKTEAGVGDVDDKSSVGASTKRLNCGISFVRIGIESGDEEENEDKYSFTKDKINKILVPKFNQEFEPWGVCCTRVEILDLMPSLTVV